MSRESDKFMLRFPDGMRDLVAESAKRQGRSMNSEIIQALHEYYVRQGIHDPIVDDTAVTEGERLVALGASLPISESSITIAQLADIISARIEERLESRAKAEVAQTAPAPRPRRAPAKPKL